MMAEKIETELPWHLVDADLRPPSKWLALAEARLVAEAGASLLSFGWLKKQFQGDGHAVLIIPGIGQDDHTTAPLRWALQRLGYAAHGWGQGRNNGSSRAGEGLAQRFDELFAKHGPVSLIGWSWGGIHARELAKQQPDRVRCVITLGTPFTGNPTANNLTWLFERLNGKKAAVKPRWFQLREPPPVPNTSIYSRSDGIIAWECCLNEESLQSENVEVYSSHLGMAYNPATLYVIADRLAQARAQWSPFEVPASLRRLFPSSNAL